MFWNLSKYQLVDNASFNNEKLSFYLDKAPTNNIPE
jgi:hypothetical protein